MVKLKRRGFTVNEEKKYTIDYGYGKATLYTPIKDFKTDFIH